MKKTLASVALMLAMTASVQARNLKAEPDLSHDLWWNAPETPFINIALTDTLGAANVSEIEFYITKDTDESQRLFGVKMPVAINAGTTDTVSFSVTTLEPGFYKCFVKDDGCLIRQFNIGYEPTNIVSLPDAPADFDQFWEKTMAELAAIPANFKMTEAADLSGKKRKVYDVEMQSLGGETIRGRIYIPVKAGKHPALVYYNGYGSKPWPMNPDDNPEIIEFVTGVRGQMFNEPYNTYGDWIRYNIGDPENYYYRGAFADVVRFLDFVQQLDSVDPERIFVEGGSQGGALTLVAGAFCGDKINTIFPYIPFLSDYPDYFQIVEWPGNAVMEGARERGISEKDAYDCLRYFDIKNLARRINCPVMMGIGLQDPVCPPHTNLSSYNLITTPKQLIIFPTKGHTVDYGKWNLERDKIIYGK